MRPKKNRTSLISKYPALIESGTKEYQKKKKIELEKIDPKGIFRRAKVLDQKVFDKLFIEEHITANQFAAANMYLELMGIAGAFLRSPSMEGSEKSTGRDVADSMAAKIMVIAKARDALRKSGVAPMHAVESCVAFDEVVSLDDLKTGLDVLVKHFRIA